jgi:hypothetical protein
MLVLCFKQSKFSYVFKGQTWRNDDRIKEIREQSDGSVNCVMLLVYVMRCCCELWEGEKVSK